MSAAVSHPENVTVEVLDLRKSFGSLPVLNGVSFKVNPGEVFVIMGSSGSGKSVLLKHIIGLLSPDSGEILIDGQSIDDPGVRDKYRMAMVFQSGALLTSLSVGENVGLYLTEHQPQAAGGNRRPGRAHPRIRRPQGPGETVPPPNFPAACRNASPSPAPWSSNPN